MGEKREVRERERGGERGRLGEGETEARVNSRPGVNNRTMNS